MEYKAVGISGVANSYAVVRDVDGERYIATVFNDRTYVAQGMQFDMGGKAWAENYAKWCNEQQVAA